MAARNLDYKKAEKKPRLDSEADGSHHFAKGNSEDEVELKFDDGNSLFVSKGFLSYSSPVFKRMFESRFKEKKNKTVELKKKKYEAFLEMLLFLHPGEQKKLSNAYRSDVCDNRSMIDLGQKTITDELETWYVALMTWALHNKNAKLIYIIAHEYQITTALKSAQKIMVEMISSNKPSTYILGSIFLENNWKELIFAEAYGDQLLISAATERLSTHPIKNVIEKSHYSQISDSSKVKLLMYRLERVCGHCKDKTNYDELQLN